MKAKRWTNTVLVSSKILQAMELKKVDLKFAVFQNVYGCLMQVKIVFFKLNYNLQASRLDHFTLKIILKRFEAN